MGTRIDFKNYFKEIAENHLQLQGRFIRSELDEFLTGLNNIDVKPTIILESSDYRINNTSPDNVLRRRTLPFMVVMHVERPDDFEAQETAYDVTESIVDDIIAKLNLDCINQDHEAIQGMDIIEIEVIPVANIGDMNYGQRCEIIFSKRFEIDSDPSKWKEGYVNNNYEDAE